MAFDIREIQTQLEAAPIVSPYSHDLALAIICDTFRLAKVRPPSRADWGALEDQARSPLWREQVVMLAHVLVSSALRQETVQALTKNDDATTLLQRFFQDVAPLTAEMIRSNTFRREEFLRKWVRVVGGECKGESPKGSVARIEQLDYRKAEAEMRRAEEARKKEADKRQQALREAEQRATEARGWRE
ncbi:MULTISPECIES: hypothetical protein [Myxococcus]|uniref:Uncharacterized protein n=1 Tax=Myxococcus virescens TaxID=83456 RepID=A0A511HP24_9BACT|nr:MULTISPECIES: hypothetical protein [Myxococcus]WNZ62598.1 hypothetical protein QEG98_01805 [Myxococcus sp. MxC21-1]GEL75336.1 hypothetical protein MVI01_71200 [Myxococcus virescens]SDF34072.1 hypothetical protein SAMN04488504_13216 [Myxococcus virescens]